MLSEFNLQENWKLLSTAEEPVFNTSEVCAFIQAAIPEKYRRGNALYQAQLFLNAYAFEKAVRQLNPMVHFVEAGHESIKGGRGSFKPDFMYNNWPDVFTFDTKTFAAVETFAKCTPDQLNDADLVIAFVFSEPNYYVRWRNDDGAYSAPAKLSELTDEVKRKVSCLDLPDEITMIKFDYPATHCLDRSIPKTVTYRFKTYFVNNTYNIKYKKRKDKK